MQSCRLVLCIALKCTKTHLRHEFVALRVLQTRCKGFDCYRMKMHWCPWQLFKLYIRCAPGTSHRYAVCCKHNTELSRCVKYLHASCCCVCIKNGFCWQLAAVILAHPHSITSTLITLFSSSTCDVHLVNSKGSDLDFLPKVHSHLPKLYVKLVQCCMSCNAFWCKM